MAPPGGDPPHLGQVVDAALDDAARRVEVVPLEEAEVRLLEVRVDPREADDLHDLRERQDGLAQRLDEPVLALNGGAGYTGGNPANIRGTLTRRRTPG